jgi:hypothetical protein
MYEFNRFLVGHTTYVNTLDGRDVVVYDLDVNPGTRVPGLYFLSFSLSFSLSLYTHFGFF